MRQNALPTGVGGGKRLRARLWILLGSLGLATCGLSTAATTAAAQDTGGQIAAAGITLSTSALSIPEGSTNTYTVRLATAPTADVTVALSQNNTGDDNITFDTDPDTAGNQSTLTFTATTWNADQTVTAAAAQDTDKLNGTATITHTATSTDSNYNNIAASLTATEGDNDVCEGSTAVGNLTTLVGDCNILLSTKAIFDSTAVLNWSPDLAMNSWQGIQYSNGRVSNISLLSKNLTGQIPKEFGNLAELKWLNLGFNNLTGIISEELGDLTKLTGLDLNYNNLSGPIPEELGNLTKLTQLTLRNNNLSGTIPEELGDLTKLKWLNLGSNNLSGTIPEELGDLTELTQLTLRRNNLSGTIPEQIGNLTELTLLHLDENNLSGTIPEELGDLTKLIQLHLDENNLSGTIPEQIGNLTELLSLLLSSNSLSGPIPTELGDLTELLSLYLHRNNLSGTIPENLGDLTKLTSLALSTNTLSGPIPTELGNLTKLTLLALHGNNLSGPIPEELGDLTKLTTLYLSSNRLTGCLPLTLSKFLSPGTNWNRINPQQGGVIINICPNPPTFPVSDTPAPTPAPHFTLDPFTLIVARICAILGGTDYGDHPDDLAKDVCSTGARHPSTPKLTHVPDSFYSGIVTGPDYCTNQPFGDSRTYPHDDNRDGIAETCSLPHTRREAVVRYIASVALASDSPWEHAGRLAQACATPSGSDTSSESNGPDEDICPSWAKPVSPSDAHSEDSLLSGGRP